MIITISISLVESRPFEGWHDVQFRDCTKKAADRILDGRFFSPTKGQPYPQAAA
jgi:hypothetical protein